MTQSYDGDRLRVKKVENGETTYYVRSSVLGGQVVAELKQDGEMKRGYVYLGGQLLAIQQDNAVTWAHQDPVTKSQRFTNSTGGLQSQRIDLDPWGTETVRTVDPAILHQKPTHRFTTYERDANGTDEAMHRRYNSVRSRFEQPDPWDGSYELANPQSLNRYSYVENDPVNFIDPTGLEDVEVPPCEDGNPCPIDFGVVTTTSSFNYSVQMSMLNFLGWVSYLSNGGGGVGDLGEGPVRGGGGVGGTTGTSPQEPAPTPPTDCQWFANMVEEIAGRSNNAEDFMNEMARTFTGGSDSSIGELYRNRGRGGNINFDTDNGFKPQFQDDSPQIRHFTAGLIAGYNLGATAGRIAMNSNEWGGNEAASRADYALNRVSTRLGAQNIVPYPAYTTGGNIRGERYEVKHPARPGYRALADLIRRQVCQ